MKLDDETAAPAPEAEATEVEQAAAAKPKRTRKPKPAAPPPGVDFRALGTVEQLVEAYNDMVPTAVDFNLKKVQPVVMFGSTDIGRTACERLHASITKARALVERKDSTPTKAKSTQKETNMARKTAKKSNASRKAAKKTTKKATGTARSARFKPEAKITIIGKDNPKRKGSEQYERFKRLSNAAGKTVEAYLKNGESTTLRHAVEIGFAKVS